jgi:hypothetical protein
MKLDLKFEVGHKTILEHTAIAIPFIAAVCVALAFLFAKSYGWL